MGLIHDDVLPFELEDLGHADTNSFERSETHIEFPWLQFIFQDFFPFSLGSNQVENSNFWTPLLELFLPVWDDSLWHNDEEIVLYKFELSKES